VGCKPSFGSINRAGLKIVAESLDTIGLIARSAEDIALLLHVLSGRAIPDLQAVSGRKPRIGLFRTPRWHEADAATHAAIENSAARLAKAGASVSEFEAPPGYAQLFDDQNKIMCYEEARAFAWEHASHADQLSDSLRERIEEGWAVPREAYDAARLLARDCRRRLAEQMRDCDYLLTPSAPGEAPATLAKTGSSLFNRVWTLLGVPCVTLPFGTGPNGLPLGVQLVGSFDGDSELLAWANWTAATFA
jgi:Asp-tRNA(Asn)/Glu-tRNA(Gln) amidotransferase A subunit family amidase